MKKKSILLAATAVMLVAATSIGGMLAYFTDTDAETNTFTAGGVSIDLIEQQVNADGTALEAFEQDQVLMPIVGSAQGEKDAFGQPVAANYIDKKITVKNDGKSDAYVRAYFAIPSALDDGSETFNAGLNILHFNFGNKKVGDDWVTTQSAEWLWNNSDGSWKYYETVIDSVNYNVYYADYYKTIAPNETTEEFVSGVYLDKDVNMNADGQYTITRSGMTTVIDGFDGSAVCPVYAVAVQAAGFDNAGDAVEAAFGADFDPFNA